MADPLTESQKQLKARGVPLTRAGELGRSINKGLGAFGNMNPTLAAPALLEKILESVRGEGGVAPTSILEGLLGPSKELQGLGSLANRDEKDGIASKLLGIDLADLPGTGVGRPDMAELVRSYTKDGNIGGARIPLGEAGLLSKPYPAHLSNAKAKEQAKRMFLANRSGLSNYIAPDREPSSPEEIQALIDSASKTKDLSKVLPISDSVDGPTPGELLGGAAEREAEEKALANQEASFDRKAEDAFVKSVANLTESDAPTTSNRKELLEKYKQEFAEATGLKIDGNVDRSDAMIAFGLELMKNKAGKGFNVGKIASAVGEAGTAALPILRQASKEAQAAKLAAGKYALDQIKAGESAQSAFAKEVRTNNFNWLLKKLELQEKARIEEIKNSGKTNEMKNVASVPIGAGDMKVRIGEQDGVSKFASGPTDAGAIVNAYTKYTEGQENIDIMNDALTAISNEDSSAISVLSDRAKSLGVAWGVVDGVDMFGEKGISNEAEFEKYRQATINAFKKLILQESQVSNLDLTTLFASFGEVNFMKNPKEAEAAIDLMNQYFAAKKRSLEPVLSDFYDRDWFRSDEDYERTQEKLSKLGATYSTKAEKGSSGRLEINLASIPKLQDIAESQ